MARGEGRTPETVRVGGARREYGTRANQHDGRRRLRSIRVDHSGGLITGRQSPRQT